MGCPGCERLTKERDDARALANNEFAQIQRDLAEGAAHNAAGMKENAALRDTVKALKVDIAGRSEITLLLQQKYEVALLQIEAMRPVVNAARDYADAFHMTGCGSGEINDTGKGLRIKQAMLRALEKLDEFILKP